MHDALRKKKTFLAKNQLVRLADTPVANLIKAKSTEYTILNRQYSFIDFWHFLASDAKWDDWVGYNLWRHTTLTEPEIDLWPTLNLTLTFFFHCDFLFENWTHTIARVIASNPHTY